MEDKIKQLKDKFISEFTRKGTNYKCPVCGQNQFNVEGPFSKGIQSNPGTFVLGGPSVPTMGVICKNCGYIAEFALGVLGLLEEMKKEDKKNE